MATARQDLDIVWILLLACALGVGVWKHAEISNWVSDAWTRTAGLR